MFSQYKMLMLSLEVEIIFNFVSIPKIMEDDAPFWASLVAQMVKNLPAMQETLGQEDPLEKEMATHSSILAWRIPRTEEPGGYSPWVAEPDVMQRLILSLSQPPHFSRKSP